MKLTRRQFLQSSAGAVFSAVAVPSLGAEKRLIQA